jgi:SGNH hydrolase-like domain, acetyltransferase AlgX
VRRSRARALFPVVAGGLGLLLALAAGELAVRLIGRVIPGVRYLATARARAPAPRFASLEEYLASKPEHVVPHRRWFNYWANALGLNDEEFTVPKPAGRFRIMAVGDSFTHGLVPYPQSVMTLVEGALRAACSDRDLDLLNFGIGAAGVPDYRTIVELGYATYAPDLVLLNFYVGNDAPDFLRSARGRRSVRRLLRRSHLWSFVENTLRLGGSLADRGALARSVRGPAGADRGPGERPRGGHVVDPQHPLRDDDPALVGPIFEEEAFIGILADELGRFHAPGDPQDVGRTWKGTLEDLEAIRAHVARHGGRLVITLYPSVLQVDAGLRTALIAWLRDRRHPAGLEAEAIDPGLPSRIVAEYCRAQGISCFDLTAVFVQASRESPAPLYKARDAHWTPRGNRVAAEAQARHLAPLICPAARLVPGREPS